MDEALDKKIKNLQYRTDQKIRFAMLHLEELKAHGTGRGDDFERSHQEAFLAQLFGAYYAFLQEVNIYLDCNLAIEGVSPGAMRDNLTKKGKSSPMLAELHQLSKQERSWFWYAKEMRDYSTHIKGIPLSFYAGGATDGKVALKHPASMEELADDAVDTFTSWLQEMEQLITKYRARGVQGLLVVG